MAAEGNVGQPDPTTVSTAAEFVDAMRRLKLWTGWGFRRLEERAAAAGQSLPRSTLTVALARATLPREDLVTAFARACGCDEDQTARWVAARRRIAGAPDPAPQPVVTGPPAGARRRMRVGWPVRAAVILLVCAMATAGILLGMERPDLPGQGAGQDPATPTQPDPGRLQPLPPTPSPTTAPTTTASPDPGQPAGPAATADPILEVTVPGPSVPLPGIPTSSVITIPEPPTTTTPTTATIRLPDDRTIQCPMPYLRGDPYGPMAVCTQQSGNLANIGYYSPLTGQFEPFLEELTIVEPTWYDAEVLATDGISARARGYATVRTTYGAAVWATQYQQGRARWGRVNLIKKRFYPDRTGWLPT